MRPSRCLNCGCARLVERSVYTGDYHSPPTDDDFWERWQCIQCGSLWHPGPHKLVHEGTRNIVLRPYEINEAKVRT